MNNEGCGKMSRMSYEECVSYCGFHNLPEGIDQLFKSYTDNTQADLISAEFFSEVCTRFEIPMDKQEYLHNAMKAIEADEVLFSFTKFIIWDMCNARNRCEMDDYQSLTPTCMSEYGEAYSLLLLLACVEPSMKLLEKRGVPVEYYKEIPFSPMKAQFKKLKESGDVTVSDFPWDINFYTCAIYLMDRFYFIPYKFGDNFTMYRSKDTGKVIALRHAGEEFRSDGQFNGMNDVFDQKGKFVSEWFETETEITANPISPMGYVKREAVTLNKNEWEVVLHKGDILLALHVPSGPGYTPERVKTSMTLAIDFYHTYYPELDIKGFWSESWLYDSRLSLVLEEKRSNIVKVQRQFYLYPVAEGDGMLRYEAFGDWKADPLALEAKSSLHRAVQEYMKTGARFNTLSMIVLKEEIERMGSMPYILPEDIKEFQHTVDNHMN